MKTLLTYIRSQKTAPNGEKWNFSALSKNRHLTWTLMRENPDLPWVHTLNPNVTEEIIQAHPEIPWNFAELGMNRNLSIEFFLRQNGTYINWPQVMNNARMTFSVELIERLKSTTTYDTEQIIRFLSPNPNLQLADLYAHPDLGWRRNWLFNNPNLTWEFILHTPMFVQGEWSFALLSDHPNISVTQIFHHWGLGWNWCGIFSNPTLTEGEAQTYLTMDPPRPDIQRARHGLAVNPNLRLSFLMEHQEKMYIRFYDYLSDNPNLYLEELLSYPALLSKLHWSDVLRSLRGISYQLQLATLQLERTNPFSYWSLLPGDMLDYYLEKYFD